MEAEDSKNDENLQQPWAQLPGESTRWYGRFLTYRDLGSNRTFIRAFNADRAKDEKGPKNCLSQAYGDASREFRWAERAEAYDTFLREEQAKEAAELRKQEQSMFLELQRQQVQDELAVARKLLLKAHDLLEMPVERVKEEVEDEQGNTIRIIVPDHNSFRTAGQLVKQYSETSRLALRMPTQHTQFDVKKLTTDDLLALHQELTKEEEELKNGDS